MKDGEAIDCGEPSTYAGVNADILCISSFSSEHKGQYCCKISNDDSIIISDVASLQGIVSSTYFVLVVKFNKTCISFGDHSTAP